MYPRDDFTLKDSTSPSGLQEGWRGGSDFSTERRYNERIYFEEPHKFGIPSFLLLQVICSGNKEQWKRGYSHFLKEFAIIYSLGMNTNMFYISC